MYQGTRIKWCFILLLIVSMKVVHIGYKYGLNNTGGAAIAATRLHKALLSHGIESHYVCVRQCEEGKNVHEMPHGWKRKVFLSLTKILRCIWKFAPYRKSICLNLVPMFGLEKLLKEIKPDVVHVQWLNADVASYEQIARLPYPVVFNLHDLNLVLPESGGYPSDNRYIDGCNHRNTDWLNRRLWQRKGCMIRRLNPTFIGPSKWVIEACAKSINGKGYPGFVITNIIDPIFRYEPSLVKRHDKFVILFGAYRGRANSLKGWSDLESALALLPREMRQKTEIRIFGETAEDAVVQGLSLKFLGSISNPVKMREIYHQADVFAFPSVQETQGMTKVEAMLCGLPVVAFDRTACAEGIQHKITGWVADDIQSLAKGLEYFYEHHEDRGKVAQLAAELFDEKRIVDSIFSVYRKVDGRV